MYAHVTGGRSLFDAVSNALLWFEDDHWKGPRPTAEAVMDVTFVGSQERYFVRCGRVRRWRTGRPSGAFERDPVGSTTISR